MPSISVVIWIYFLYYSPWRIIIWRENEGTASVRKGVQLSVSFNQPRAAIYLRSTSYLVDYIYCDIVTEHWCQVCVLFIMSLPLRLPALVSMVSNCAIGNMNTGRKIQNDVRIDTYYCKPEIIAFHIRFLSPTLQKCADSSTYWQIFYYRPHGKFRYTMGGIANIWCQELDIV